jgi:hypothetical protein
MNNRIGFCREGRRSSRERQLANSHLSTIPPADLTACRRPSIYLHVTVLYPVGRHSAVCRQTECSSMYKVDTASLRHLLHTAVDPTRRINPTRETLVQIPTFACRRTVGVHRRPDIYASPAAPPIGREGHRGDGETAIPATSGAGTKTMQCGPTFPPR